MNEATTDETVDERVSPPATAARLVLWRHGVTAWNADKRFQGCNADVPLSADGVAQAQAAAPLVASYRPTMIVCSPLLRARQTADAVASLLGMAIVTDDRLREIDVGDWCGLSSRQVQELDPAYSQAIANHRDYRMGNTGETQMELGARVGEALSELARDGQCRLVVSHGWAIHMGVANLLGWDFGHAEDLRVMNNCAVSVVSREIGRWRVECWNSRR